jgi:uncharacterized membrane protein
MFCEKCGADMGENKFCPQCGAGIEKSFVLANQSKSGAIAENTAGLLCYILGWITGIVFLIIDKRPFVRFQAAQSIVTFGTISVFTVLFNRLIYFLPYTMWRLLSGIDALISLGSIALAIILMIQAHNGKYFKLPVAGAIAERLAKKSEISL